MKCERVLNWFFKPRFKKQVCNPNLTTLIKLLRQLINVDIAVVHRLFYFGIVVQFLLRKATLLFIIPVCFHLGHFNS